MLKLTALTILSILTFTTATRSWSADIVCPTQAPVGSPVLIKTEPTPSDTVAVKFIKEGFDDSDVFLELFDAKGSPVTIFWSLVAGPRRMTLISATAGDTAPVIEMDTHVLYYGGTGPDPPPPPPPGPTPPVPSDTMKQFVAPLVAYVAATTVAAPDTAKLVQFYMDFAKVVDDPATPISDTNAFRTAYINAGKTFFSGTGIDNKYGGLSGTVDKVLQNVLGLDITPLDRAKASEALRAIAWAFWSNK